MNKTIFRGKSKEAGKFVFGDLLQGTDGRKYIITLCDNVSTWKYTPRLLFEEIDAETVGQFTGLLDKNNTKIFEGDVLVNRLNSLVDKNNFRVKWNGYCSGFMWKEGDKSDYMDQSIAKNCEVIGNLHENPELLEVAN